MKAIAVRRDEATLHALVDRVLCHDVRDASGKIVGAKGTKLDRRAADALLASPWDEVHVLDVEPGDLHEEAAGQRAATAAVGDGVQVKGYTGGQWTLVASRRGLLSVRRPALADVNTLAGISVFTLFDGQPVEPGEVVAKAKVTPLVIGEETIRQVEQIARGAQGLVSVAGFRAEVVGVVARETLDSRQRARFEGALAQKIDWFDGRLLPIRYTGGSARAVADEIVALADLGATVLIVAGASALDPLDPVFGALALLGARMERHGVPAHPGSLLWLAFWAGRAVVGMPTCGMFSQATTFDLVLPRLLAGASLSNRDVAEMGHGGLLSRDMAYRFPPYRPSAARGELE
ncbi:MAG: hypothetical protein HYU51_14985 [Candidatus Rokubacteria bacterium]|nr:hypothetical protein [Candidatus Rokubacteria bacterium]